MEDKIKHYLEEIFHIEFVVKRKYAEFEEYEIKPSSNLNDTFVLKLIMKEDIRLTIICEPDTYGRNFLENINKSKKEQRNIFCEYWEELDERKVKLLINNKEYSKDEFLEDKNNWRTFLLKFSKNAYYDEENENKIDVVLNYITLVTAMILSILAYEVDIDELDLIQDYIKTTEGTAKEVKTIKYERNPINRQICLAHKGYKCSVCGIELEDVYGDIGKNFIEVHHIVPVSKMDEDYNFDPIKDLYPLCPNCHSMIHRKDPPYSIKELKEIFYRNK